MGNPSTISPIGASCAITPARQQKPGQQQSGKDHDDSRQSKQESGEKTRTRKDKNSGGLDCHA